MKINLLCAASVLLLLCRVSSAAPFELTIVPQRHLENGEIIRIDNPVHLILQNTSDTDQKIFETWNSWGYQAISLIFDLPDGSQETARVKQQRFTRNFPSTFQIAPGSFYVFSLTLDERWEGLTDLKKFLHQKIKLTAVYEIGESEESKEHKVWVGKESSETLTAQIFDPK